MDTDAVAAGVELLDRIAAGGGGGPESSDAEVLRASNDEMLLKNRILLSRAHGDRLAKERAEDDLKYARHQLQQRDRLVESLRDAQQKQHVKCVQLQRELDERDSGLATLKGSLAEARQQVAHLQTETKRLRDELAAARKGDGTAGGGSSSAAAAAGVRRFAEMHKDKVTIIRLKKRVEALRQQQEAHSRSMESALMARHDTYVASYVTIQAIEEAREGGDAGSAAAGDAPQAADPFNGRPKLITYDALRRSGRRGVLPFDEQLDLKMPEDGYIAAKVEKSSFAASIGPLRGEFTKMAHEWKAFMDTTLSSLWYIFQEQEKRGKSILANPRDDFMKEVHGTLKKTKAMLFAMMKSMNNSVKDVLNAENAVKIKWVKQARPSRDAECEACIPPPEDPRIAELNEKVSFLTDRIASMREEHMRVVDSLELEKEKAEVNTQFLQNKVITLHDAVYTALHSVYKHRFHWIHRLPNSFAQIDKNASRKRQLEVHYNVEVAKAIDEDVRLLHKFAEYFVSDETFGVDLSGARNVDAAACGVGQAAAAGVSVAARDGATASGAVGRRKEAVPTKKKIDNARRLSSEVETFMKREITADENAENVAPGGFAKGGAEQGNPLCGVGMTLALSNSDADEPTAVRPQPPPAGLKRRGSFSGVTNSVATNGASSSTVAQTCSAPFNSAPAAIAAAAAAAEGLQRMEAWQRKQHDLWEHKKARQFSGTAQMATMVLQLDPNVALDGYFDTFGGFDNNRAPIGYRRTSVSSQATVRRGSAKQQ